ncbi:MAG: DNA polymerase III subunit [Bacillota bacterium]|nr:DNA polymerase III subunit [Bacillota bacterium]
MNSILTENVFGNESVRDRLEQAVRTDTISHAYIFSGQAGLYKSNTALLFAQMILCDNENKPCGHCPSCLKVSSGNHPDMLVTDAGDNVKSIKVELIRSIRSQAYIMPSEGKRKIFIIRDAHKMTIAAQNALLKIFEEPPSSAVFILVTENLQKLLPTVKSRGSIINFISPSIEDTKLFLNKKYESKYPKELISNASSFAGGAPGEAENILENTKVTGFAPGFFKAAVSGDLYTFLQRILSMTENRTSFLQYCDSIIKGCSDLIKIKGQSNGNLFHPESRQILTEYSRKLTRANLFNIIDIIHKCRDTAENTNTSLSVVAMNMLLKCWEEIH